MAKFLWKASYTTEGVKGVLKDGGTGRRDAVQKLIESSGGKMEAFYFALGDVDAYVIADFPDDASLVALELAVNATGRVNSTTVKLITPEDVDKATKKAVTYSAPGG